MEYGYDCVKTDKSFEFDGRYLFHLGHQINLDRLNQVWDYVFFTEQSVG